MRSLLISLALALLVACGDDESGPDDETPDAAAEEDAGEQPDAGGETGDAEPDGEAAGNDAGMSEDPHIELSGALTETLANIVPAASLSKSSDTGTLILLPAGATSVRAGFTFTFKGAPKAGETYDQTQSGVTCALTAARASDNATWDAVRAITGAPDQGTCSLSLTSVEESVDTEALKQYKVHGTLEGTLPAKADSGAEGSVTMHAVF
jgi:hypothetical protein